MATLTVQTPSATGTVITYSTPAGSDKFLMSGKESVRIKNAGAGPIQVTFDSPNTCSFGLAASASHDLVVTVAAGDEQEVKMTDTNRFKDSQGYCNMSYDTLVDTRIAVVRE